MAAILALAANLELQRINFLKSFVLVKCIPWPQNMGVDNKITAMW